MRYEANESDDVDAGRVCESFRVHAYPRWSRALAIALLAVAGASVPLLLLAVVFSTDPPLYPLVLVQLFAVFAVLPATTAWLVGRALGADLEVYEHELVLRRRGVRVEIPTAAIADVLPWRVPLPGPGLALRMRSGRRFRQGLQLADPGALAAALAEIASADGARAARAHPIVAYAAARAAVPWRWRHRLAKFVLFGLAPTLVLFNAHQHIAYGGFLGEYYLLGFASWTRTLLVYWTTIVIYLVLYAGVWRGVAEICCMTAAAVAPSLAARARRLAEIGCRLAYYAGVPIMVGLRFLS